MQQAEHAHLSGRHNKIEIRHAPAQQRMAFTPAQLLHM
jgi:hypothetical protein